MLLNEVRECTDVIRELLREVPADRVILSGRCADLNQNCIQILTLSAEDLETPDFLVLNQGCTQCDQVVRRNDMINISCMRPMGGDPVCSLLKAENLISYLGVPVHDLEGEPIAALSLSTHLPRIWSQNEVAALKLAAATLRSLLFDAQDGGWREALQLRDTR